MGLILGPYVLLAYAMANILGVLGAVPMLMRARSERRAGAPKEPGTTPAPPASIPFGPFLALGGVLTALWGPAIWAAYLQFLGVGVLR
jgi:hypothetical protein